jgi:hypothetical protein
MEFQWVRAHLTIRIGGLEVVRPPRRLNIMRTESRASLALLLAVCGLACSSAKAQDIIAGPFNSDVHAYDLISSASC